MSTLFVVQFCFLQTRTLNDSESKKQLALVMEIFTVGRLLSICTLTEPGGGDSAYNPYRACQTKRCRKVPFPYKARKLRI